MATAKQFAEMQKAGDWMKLVEGQNRFRALEAPLEGVRIWVNTKEGKKSPMTLHNNDSMDIVEHYDIVEDKNGRKQIQDVFMMPVWNFNLSLVQILVIYQRGILTTLQGYRDSNWGELTEYPIIITRVGTTVDNTEYSLVIDKASKEEELEWEKIQQDYFARGVDMELMYSTEVKPFGGFPLQDSKDKDNTNSVEKAFRFSSPTPMIGDMSDVA